MSYFLRLIKFALQDFRRNIWLSLVTISILVLTLLSINVLVVFNAMTSTAIKVIEDKVDLSLYFKASATEEGIGEVKSYLATLPEVSSVIYTSKEEALTNFKKTHQDNATILSAIDELAVNPLGATLRVKANSLEQYPLILTAVDKPEFNDLIASKNYDNRQEMIGKVASWTNAGEKIVLIFILFFVLVSALIVFNTIRVAIYTHREEIGIEKLVGATNWFVSLPFILESVIYGLLSTVVGIIIIYPVLNVIQPALLRFFGAGQLDIVGYFNSNFVLIFGAEFIVVTLLNALASFLATRKYLKV